MTYVLKKVISFHLANLSELSVETREDFPDDVLRRKKKTIRDVRIVILGEIGYSFRDF